MTFWEGILLGVIQGFTEFLPVSSSGHLVLVSYFLGVREASIAFDILLHLGTLVAVVVAFFPEIVFLFQGFLKIVKSKEGVRKLLDTEPSVRLLFALALGTLPTVILTILLRGQVERLFSAPLFAGKMLFVTGTLLFVAEKIGHGTKKVEEVTKRQSLFVGIAQAFAVIPGISRSGSTIAMGLVTGFSRESAARFAFLLSIPANLGAMVLAMRDLLAGRVETPLIVMLPGIIVSAITGYIAILLLLQVMKKGRLIYFSYYTWGVGLLFVLWTLWDRVQMSRL